MKKILGLILLLCLIVGSVTAYFILEKSPESVNDIKPDYILKPDELVNTFTENEKKANSLYLDKVIQIEGAVASIETSAPDKITLYVEGNAFGNISCLFNKDQITGSEIKVGDVITAKGKCSGYILDVVLIKCSIVE